MDSENQLAMNLGETYLVTEKGMKDLNKTLKLKTIINIKPTLLLRFLYYFYIW